MTLLISPRSGNVGDLVDVARAGAELLQVVDSATLPVSIGSDSVANESDAPGATVSDALNGIGGAVATLDTDAVDNASAVGGATASEALDALQAQFTTLAEDTAGTGLHATGVTPQQLTTRIRPRLVQIADYFISGTTVSGGIGALGWTLGTGIGTPSVSRGSTGSFSTNPHFRLTLNASTGAGDRSTLLLGATETATIMRPSELNILQMCCGSALTNRRIFFGLSDSFNAAPTAMTNAIGWYYDSVSANWQFLTRSASVGAPVITTTPVGASAAELFTIVRIADDNYQFYIGNTLVGTLLAGVADSTLMGLGYQVTAISAGPGAGMNIGPFLLQAVGSGVLASDTFLQG